MNSNLLFSMIFTGWVILLGFNTTVVLLLIVLIISLIEWWAKR